jgi:hypothetical protein
MGRLYVLCPADLKVRLYVDARRPEGSPLRCAIVGDILFSS